jgi:hypothetical protein
MIEKNIGEVLEVMGKQFAQVDLWSSNFFRFKTQWRSKV